MYFNTIQVYCLYISRICEIKIVGMVFYSEYFFVYPYIICMFVIESNYTYLIRMIKYPYGENERKMDHRR